MALSCPDIQTSKYGSCFHLRLEHILFVAKVVTSLPKPLCTEDPFALLPCVPTQANLFTVPWGRVALCSMMRERLQKPSQNAQVTAVPVRIGQALLSSVCQPEELVWYWKHMAKDVLKVG